MLPAHAGMIPVMRVAKIEEIVDRDRTAGLARGIVELAEEKGCNLLELKIAAESVAKSTKAVLETKAKRFEFRFVERGIPTHVLAIVDAETEVADALALGFLRFPLLFV